MCPKGTSYLLFITKVFYNLIKWFYHFYSQSESVDNTIEYSTLGTMIPFSIFEMYVFMNENDSHYLQNFPIVCLNASRF